MSYRFSFNADQITEAAKEAFTDTLLLYERELTKVVSEPGAFESHPDADIVDTGRLRSAQTPIKTGDLEAEIYYPVEYAVYVHEGYVTRKGNVVIGRPWTEIAAERLNLEEAFNQSFKEKL